MLQPDCPSSNAVPKPGQPFAVRGISLPQGLTVEKVNRREKLLKDIDTRLPATPGLLILLTHAIDFHGSEE